MRFICLIYNRESGNPPDDQVIADHISFARDALARGVYQTCDALERPSNARTVRVRDGEILTTDGPFAETKEVLGGFYMLECKDIDEAVSYAARIPGAQRGCIEVRPIAVIPGWEEAIGLVA